MSRIIIVDIDKRQRPKLVTPSKGSEGDLTNESQRPLTDVNFILNRYAGNLAELNAWRSNLKYGDQSSIPEDLVEAFNVLKNAHDAFDNIADNPFASFDDAMSAIADGTFIDKISKKTGEKPVEKPAEKPVETTVDNSVDKGDNNNEEK